MDTKAQGKMVNKGRKDWKKAPRQHDTRAKRNKGIGNEGIGIGRTIGLDEQLPDRYSMRSSSPGSNGIPGSSFLMM